MARRCSLPADATEAGKMGEGENYKSCQRNHQARGVCRQHYNQWRGGTKWIVRLLGVFERENDFPAKERTNPLPDRTWESFFGSRVVEAEPPAMELLEGRGPCLLWHRGKNNSRDETVKGRANPITIEGVKHDPVVLSYMMHHGLKGLASNEIIRLICSRKGHRNCCSPRHMLKSARREDTYEGQIDASNLGKIINEQGE